MRLRVELVRANHSCTVEVDPFHIGSMENLYRELSRWAGYACELARSSGTCVGFGVGVHHQGADCDHDAVKAEGGVL